MISNKKCIGIAENAVQNYVCGKNAQANASSMMQQLGNVPCNPLNSNPSPF